MCSNEVISGLIIGSIAGFVGGTLVWLVSLWRDHWFFERDKERIYTFLNKETDQQYKQRSATVIGINTNIPRDRVIYISYKDQRLQKVLNDPAELIGLKERM